MRVDLAIVGAGPAGLATAIEAARRGLEVVVLEARTPPLDKACGEGLMPGGVAALARLGIDLPRESAMPFEGVRYVDAEARATGRFSTGSGLGVRRTVLSEALLERARLAGVRIHFERRVIGYSQESGGGVRIDTREGALETRWMVGADGLNSRIRRLAGLESGAPHGRFGVRRHFRVAHAPRFVEVHWGDHVDAYVTPIAQNEIGVALIWRGPPVAFDALVARVPTLAELLADARPTSVVRGAGPFDRRVRRRVSGSVALVGDAAGYLDPLTGEGITLGLRCAEALADVVSRNAGLDEYEAAWQRITATYFRITRLLLLVSAWPALRRRVVSMLAHDPGIFDRFLEVTNGDASMRSIGLDGARRVVTGLLASQRRPWDRADAPGASLLQDTNQD